MLNYFVNSLGNTGHSNDEHQREHGMFYEHESCSHTHSSLLTHTQSHIKKKQSGINERMKQACSIHTNKLS